MSKYKKIYFLHIPKTGGRFFTRYVIDQIETVLKKNNIELIRDPENSFRHSGWHNDIDENTYVITIFREPIEFFVSAVSHIAYEKAGLIDNLNDNIVKEGSDILDIDKETLYKALKRFKILKDFQSQNFVLTPEHGSNTVRESMKQYALNNKFDKDLAYERIKRVNLMIRQKDLKTLDYQKLIKKLSEDLDIDINIDLSNIDKDRYKNHSSEILLGKLDKEDIETFYNNFLFDKKIYEDNSLFWNI